MQFLNTLSELLEKEGFLKVYEIAMEKIREYPVCYPLLLNVAMFLEGAGMYSKEGKKDLKIHKKEIEALYHRVLNSPNQNEKNYAQSMLISKYIQRKEYEKAEEMLQSLPEKTSVDKKQLQINLFLSRGKLEEAAKLEEEKTIFIHYRNSECFIDADGDCIKTRKKRRRRIFRRGVKAGGKII